MERDRRDEREGEEGIQVEASKPLFLVSCLINNVFLFYTMRCRRRGWGGIGGMKGKERKVLTMFFYSIL